jgi:uncharacterized membrane protein
MMHLIPASWAHLHILASVFPSVGLVFALGLYATGMLTGSIAIKRTCLLAFGILALLALATFVSGNGSMDELAANPKFTEDAVDSHYSWGVAAIAVLVLTGLVAWIELLRSARAKELSDNAVHLVLGLAIVSLFLMAIVGELGWEINHTELVYNPARRTSAVWAHFHMILNHFPTVGFTFALGFYVIALVLNNTMMKRTCLVLFVICTILTVPTFVTGNAAMWVLTDPLVPGISRAVINAHRDWAVWSLFGVGFTGVAAWIEIFRYRYLGRLSNVSLYLVLIFGLVTLGVMAEAGHRGGQINHPEIHVATDVLPTDAKAGISMTVENEINNVLWFVPWQTVHFFGYSLIFGTALAISLRVLGFWKSMSFSAMHRILPLGAFGVAMNVFSGMLILQQDSERYLNEITFVPKLAFITIGAIAVLYFSLADSLWQTKAGEDAPMSAKWVAAIVLLSWCGVIMGGRLLPYV